MHACRPTQHVYSAAICTVMVFGFAIGCRSGRPFGSFVKVESTPTSDLPDIDAPEQRLASAISKADADGAKPEPEGRANRDLIATGASARPADVALVSNRSTKRASQSGLSQERTRSQAPSASDTTAENGSDGEGGLTFRLDDDSISMDAQTESQVANRDDSKDNHQSQNDIGRRPESSPPTEEKVAQSSDTPAENRTTSGTRRTEKLLAMEPKSESKSSRASVERKRANRGDSKTDRAQSESSKLSPEEPLERFTESAPDVQEQALRQLLALAANRAEESRQPSSIDDLLREAMKESIELPEPRRTPPELKARRLAGVDAPRSADRQTKVATNEPAPTRPDGASEITTQGDTSDGEPSRPVDGQVRMASASSSDADRVAQAIDLKDDRMLRHSRSEMPEEENAAVQSAMAQVGNAILSDEALFDMLIRRLGQETEGESAAARSRRHIMIRHLMVMAGKPDEAVQEIEGLTAEEQEFLRHQLMGLWTIIDPAGHPVPSRRFSNALPKIREATKHLAASTDSLEVKSLAFCTAIEAFGQIEEFEEAEFDPEQQVILYCEIDNFTAKPLDSGYETHLQGSYTIYNDENRKMVSQMMPADLQVSRNYLRDYFIAYQMPIPGGLSSGKYRLELTMEDVNGKKYGQSSIDFLVSP
ncbi:MAG: hypothetical protein AAF989_12490 [Planctomycetota bacterium]